MGRQKEARRHASRKKRYALLRRAEDGTLFALIDYSMCSMAWASSGATLWDSPPTHYFNPKVPDEFIARIHSKKCPIEVNMRKRWWKRRRNYYFELKEGEQDGWLIEESYRKKDGTIGYKRYTMEE